MSFGPDHPEYAQFSDIYADESSQTQHRYLLLGGVVIPTARVGDFNEAFEIARLPDLPRGELAWVKVSKAKLEAYIRVADTFFDNPFGIPRLEFHCLYIDTPKLDHKKYNSGSREVGFNKEIYLILQKFRRLHTDRLFHCYLDKRSTSSKTEDLRLILNRGAVKQGDKRDWPFRRVMFRDSAKTPAIQLVDILLGAVAYKLNGHFEAADASPAKKKLCAHILGRADIKNVVAGTPPRGNFTIWPRQLKK